MTEVSQIDGEPAPEIDRCLADLAGNEPAAAISGCLRAIEARVPAGAALRARFLRARAIANQRLGFQTEALGDLYEARQLAEGAKDWRELAEIDRAIAVVQTWRGEGREAALALLRAAAAATGIALRQAADLVPHDPECFESVELAHVEAEVALEEGDPEKAERLLADVITRYGADDLAGPEVSARLLQARALDKLGKAEE